MAERCYGPDDEFFDLGAPNRFTGEPRNARLLRPWGAPPEGWCQLQPYYRGLKSDANPKVVQKAREVFDRVCYMNEGETHVIDGNEYAFVLKLLYNDEGPNDYVYPGIAVYRRGPGAAPWQFDVQWFSTRDGAYVAGWPAGTTPDQKRAWAKANGAPCIKNDASVGLTAAAQSPLATPAAVIASAAITAAAGYLFWLSGKR